MWSSYSFFPIIRDFIAESMILAEKNTILLFDFKLNSWQAPDYLIPLIDLK
jgi:hypothetical protein